MSRRWKQSIAHLHHQRLCYLFIISRTTPHHTTTYTTPTYTHTHTHTYPTKLVVSNVKKVEAIDSAPPSSAAVLFVHYITHYTTSHHYVHHTNIHSHPHSHIPYKTCSV